LEKVRAHRAQYRRKRQEESLPVVALVGYTNAGKSTLLNALSGSEVFAADQLFATLDPTTRRIKLPGGREVLVTDTVGFIQKLPTTLVAAFRATLEEIREADVIVHVADVTHSNAEQQVATVLDVLRELGATEEPIVTALNKIDALPIESHAAFTAGLPGNTVALSALTGEGIAGLLGKIEQCLVEELVTVRLLIPYVRGDLLSLIHERGAITHEVHRPEGTQLVARIPPDLAGRVELYSIGSSD
jgi:GTP-binding protein HflX